MSRPLSNQSGHAFAPGFQPTREASPMEEMLYQLIDLALPIVVIGMLLLVFLIIMRLALGILRRRRRLTQEEQERAEAMAEVEQRSLSRLKQQAERNASTQGRYSALR